MWHHKLWFWNFFFKNVLGDGSPLTVQLIHRYGLRCEKLGSFGEIWSKRFNLDRWVTFNENEILNGPGSHFKSRHVYYHWSNPVPYLEGFIWTRLVFLSPEKYTRRTKSINITTGRNRVVKLFLTGSESKLKTMGYEWFMSDYRNDIETWVTLSIVRRIGLVRMT